MSGISAIRVKELRDRTGAGVMDCKNALSESNNDLDKAAEILEIKGKLKAAARSGKDVSDGLIGISHSGYEKAAIIEVNVETESVALSAEFQNVVYKIADVALSTDGTAESISLAQCDDGINVEDKIKNCISIVGENIKLGRTGILSVSEGVVSSYVHSAVAKSLGKIGVIVALRSSGDKEKLSFIGEQIAMHVAASSPLVISVEKLDPSIVAKRRAYYMEEIRDSDKSSDVIEKIVNGKMQKFFKEVVLLSQDFVVDPSKTISVFLKESEKVVGAQIELVDMIHFVLGS
ncbi:translation elongation factor Ts [Candidatus Liberibacter americanus]|uniref:Elongation factor Ts n=1 Tax=Candidatus Liberibacter americanus str. Sao Paulo TaxID=1261131 RepID=U6B6Q4_9HYPH|nr:translation elongation factor Ts [Candidatus Liberibacter americanus]AHA27556.1 Translation elongation factor Ts [Candidatus Liberibacter americanus str. Sao Paulo]EMS36483.1 elongation factor Ts [Candidatus Liberibacter americanus PW_SP]